MEGLCVGDRTGQACVHFTESVSSAVGRPVPWSEAPKPCEGYSPRRCTGGCARAGLRVSAGGGCWLGCVKWGWVCGCAPARANTQPRTTWSRSTQPSPRRGSQWKRSAVKETLGSRERRSAWEGSDRWARYAFEPPSS